VQAIVDRAQINKHMPYHYFDNKQGLYQAVIKRRFSELADAAIAASREALERDGPAAALRRLVEAYFDALAARPRYSRLIIWEAASAWAVMNRLVPRVRAELDELLTAILRQGIADGSFNADLDPDFVWWLIPGVISHYYADRPRMQQFWAEDLTRPDVVRRHRQEIVEFVMRGVGAPTGAGVMPETANGSVDGAARPPRRRARHTPTATSA